jgi:hypothetical protein
MSAAFKAVEDIINDGAFWTYIAELLAQRMARMNARAALLGLQAAAESGVVFDVDALYARALQQARASSVTWSRQMTDTTREALRQALITWQATGVTTPEQQRRALTTLMEGLDPMFNEDRAERVGASETTRAFDAGAALAMMADGAIGGERWETALDEKVCSVCGPRHGLIYPKGEGPACPAHIRCRCSKRPVGWREISKQPKLWQGRPIAFEVRLG